MFAGMTRVLPWLGNWRRPVAIIICAAILLALPPFFAGGFTLHLLTTGLYYTILAASWNLLAGFTGQFSLAHHAFAAIGAYTSGLLIRYYGVPIWVSIPSGVIMAALFGFALGRMVLSMRAIYLAIATWAFAETIHILLTAAYPITRGELGLNVPPLFRNLDPKAYYVLFAGLTLVSVTIMYGIVKSRIGYFMRAIRDDDLRAESLGVDTTRVKVFVFTLPRGALAADGRFQRDGEAHHHGGAGRPWHRPRTVDRRRASADSHDLFAEIRRVGFGDLRHRGDRAHAHACGRHRGVRLCGLGATQIQRSGSPMTPAAATNARPDVA
jgi:hypothetical protein